MMVRKSKGLTEHHREDPGFHPGVSAEAQAPSLNSGDRRELPHLLYFGSQLLS